jgi:hypothetical protein
MILGVDTMSANSNHTEDVYGEEGERPLFKVEIKNKECGFSVVVKKLKNLLGCVCSKKNRHI